MQRMKWLMLWWMVSSVLSQNCVSGQASCEKECQTNNVTQCAKCCLTCVDAIFRNGNLDEIIKVIESLKDGLREEEMNGNEIIRSSNFSAYLLKPNGTSEGLSIYASDQETSESPLSNSTLRIQLPREVNAGLIVLCMLKWRETKPGNKKLSCQFFNFSTSNFSQDGCVTQCRICQNNITCSCFFSGVPLLGVFFAELMLDISPSGSPDSLSSTDQKILTYISLTGCSLSLFALVITVLLFITNRKLREDVSMKVHISLVIALILLNLHFLLSQTVTAESSTGLCLYMALVLHYSLLATFSWMALEGFNLYLLVVKVFNIYVSRYLLKLSVVGWGVPAVIVSVVVIINRGFYGRVFSSDGTAMCYITNEIVKKVTTVGLFSIVFLFNVIMFVVTVKRVFSVGQSKKIDRKRVWQHICPLLGVGALLGITWGLVFFSFGHLTTPGFYLFCILNPLQGFFIFLWFAISLRRAKDSAPKTSSEMYSTSN